MINTDFKFRKFENPFPYIVIENFLEQNFYEKLETDFPNIDKFKENPRSVNRMNYDTTFGDNLYSNLIKKSLHYKKFHDYVYSEEFINFFLNKFKDNIQAETHRKFLTENIFEYSIIPDPYEINGIIGKKELKNNYDKFLYPRLDIGVGTKGYGKNNGGGGIHIDNPQRLISILFYVGGYSEIKGGEHRIWKKDSQNNTLEIHEEIKPKKNLLIAGLQNNLAFHDVNPITSVNGSRNAFYLAISSTVPIWKKVKSNKFNLKYNKNRVTPTFFQKIKKNFLQLIK
tara:strand:+ start:163 stop:1014 length:852 start_codon:yes stop_codon:yes gene_type:complete